MSRLVKNLRVYVYVCAMLSVIFVSLPSVPHLNPGNLFEFESELSEAHWLMFKYTIKNTFATVLNTLSFSISSRPSFLI